MVTNGNSVAELGIRVSIVMSTERNVSLRTRPDPYKWGEGGISQTRPRPFHVHYG